MEKMKNSFWNVNEKRSLHPLMVVNAGNAAVVENSAGKSLLLPGIYPLKYCKVVAIWSPKNVYSLDWSGDCVSKEYITMKLKLHIEYRVNAPSAFYQKVESFEYAVWKAACNIGDTVSVLDSSAAVLDMKKCFADLCDEYNAEFENAEVTFESPLHN